MKLSLILAHPDHGSFNHAIARAAAPFGRFTADTLDRLCAALNVQPGELLEFVPTRSRKRPR